MFKKISRPVPIYQEAADLIEDAILSGKLAVGQRLPAERELAQTLEISRRTLRESLRVLEQKGLVEIRNTGAVVKMATTERLTQSLALAIRTKQIAWRDIVEFRAELDGAIAYKAAGRASEEDIRVLEKIIDDAKHLLKAKELAWKEFLLLDKQMHLTLAEITGNPIYTLVTRTFLDNLQIYFEAYRTREKEFSKDNFENMQGIVEAVKKRDKDTARRLADAHLRLGSEYMKKAGVF